jgi:hypothetical protein
MKKILLSLFVIGTLHVSAQVFKAKKDACSIDFFSKASLEDIEAINKNPIIVCKPETGDLQFAVVMTQFKFKSALMEEHFNENYVESEKFPKATFIGKVNEKIDMTKDGENKVTVTGKMTIHGVTKEVTADGTIAKKEEDLVIGSTFKIKVADYNIKVPSLYVKNIAEVVDVTVKGTLEPIKK